MAQNNSYTFDAATQLKDAGLVPASAAATVGGAAKVIEVGTAYVEGVVVVDVGALDQDAGNEVYTVIVQGAAAAAFATPVQLAALSLGAAAVIPGGGIATVLGRYYIRFQNEQGGVIYPFIRLYTLAAGAGIVAGINYSAWIGDTKTSS